MVAERRNFRAAADDLGISPSALSQKIRTLEQRMGVPLLTRTTRSVGMTQAGQILFDRARPAVNQLIDAFDEATNLSQPAGLLRLHMPREVLPLLIEPIISRFCATYPRINVEITTAGIPVNLVEHGYDAAVQFGELLDSDMIALRLTPPIRFVVAGSPAYLDVHGRPERPVDLQQHQCLTYARPEGKLGHWVFIEDGRVQNVRIESRLSVNDYNLVLAAVRSGTGLAYLPGRMVERDIASGALETVLDAYMPTSDGLFLYYPNRAQTLTKLRVFIDFLPAQLGR